MKNIKENWTKVEMLVNHKMPNDNRKNLRRGRMYTVSPIDANYLLGCFYAKLAN